MRTLERDEATTRAIVTGGRVADDTTMTVSAAARRRRDGWVQSSFVLPAFIVLVALTGFPLAQVVVSSVLEGRGSEFIGLGNFQSVLSDPVFWRATAQTVVFTAATIILATVLGFALAMLLNQPIHSRFRAVMRSIFMIPWLLSSAVVGVLWVMMFQPFGLINWALSAVGLSAFDGLPWLSQPDTALLALVIANVWRALPFMMLMILAALQTVDPQLYEAASLDGAGVGKKIRHITLPQIAPMLITVITLETIWAFRSFDLIYIMTGGGPQGSTEVLSTYVYDAAFRGYDFGSASAAALVMFVIMVAMSVPYLYRNLKKEN